MYPVILGLPAYQLMHVVSNVACMAFVLWLVRRDGFRVRSVLFCVLVIQVVGAPLGAKVASLLIDGWSGPVLAQLRGGGWRYPGAILGLLGFAFMLRGWLPSGLTLGRFLDLYAPAFALENVIGRMGCILNGCCHGVVCHLPWAWRYPRGSEAWYQTILSGDINVAASGSAPVHPLPLYFLVVDLALMLICMRLLRTRRYDGQVMLIFLAVHSTAKGALELLRFEYDPVHHIVLGIGFVAAIILWVRSRQPKALGTVPG